MPLTAIEQLADFVVSARVPKEARRVAANAYLDTIGVALAGAVEPAAVAVQRTARDEGGEAQCGILGTASRTGAAWAALANGTAAHALDYDDMCFVSLAHPSAPLVSAALAGGELARAPGTALLDAWVAGFELEAVLGRAMNPRHYTLGWHCTSTIGTVGAAAAVARVLGLDRQTTSRCLAIAVSEASGIKENFGTDAKPLHAGLAARNGILAALLAKNGLTASPRALEGPQGYLKAMGSERDSLGDSLAQLGHRWEVLETGVTVKLYPSCAGTHPALDAILDLRRLHGFGAGDVATITVGVDAVTPTILLYDRPTTGLEGKFSMQYCTAAAVVTGGVGLDTFEPASVGNSAITTFMSQVTMNVDPSLNDDAPPLTQARVTVRLKDGRTLEQYADGARGYPARPASQDDLANKFRTCAGRVLPPARLEAALRAVRSIDQLEDTRTLTDGLRPA